MSTRERKDMVRFLSRSKGILLGTREMLGMEYSPWDALMSCGAWHHTMDVEYLLNSIQRQCEWLRAALGHLARAAAENEDNDSILSTMEKAADLLKDYGNNRRLKS